MSTKDDISPYPIPVYDAIDLGRAIARLRRRRRWSQSDLADWVGVHRVTVSKLEHGGTVDLPTAVRALAILGARLTIEPRARAEPPHG